MNELTSKNASILKSSVLENSTYKKDSKSNESHSRNSIILNSSKTIKTKPLTNELHKVPFYPASTQMSSKSLKKSIAENNLVTYDNERATLFSTWTPLSDEKTNQKVNFFFNFYDMFSCKY